VKSGLTARAKLLGKVHGVVVQAMKLQLGSLTKGKVTIIAGSEVSL